MTENMNQKPHYIAIAAMSDNRAIGKEWKIPWYIPEDFRHFKETTLGAPIIMGRKTYESIGRPLPGRENIVLTRGDYTAEWVTVLHSIDELDEYLMPKGWNTETAGLLYSNKFSIGPTSQWRGQSGQIPPASEWKNIKAFICGGGEIYKLFFDLGKTDEVILSRVNMVVEDADAYLVEFESDFELVRMDEREEFSIEYWTKKHNT